MKKLSFFPKIKIEPKNIRLIELFAGIGAQAKALENLGIDFEHYRICEFDKYAVNSYNAVHHTNFETSDITKITANDLGIVDTDKYTYIMTYSFPCFLPTTMVLTNDGFKNIEDVNNGDLVLTHKNRYQPVVKTMKNYCNESIYKINAMCSDPIFTTKEHPFYVRELTRKWDNSCRTYKRLFDTPKWVKAKDLSKDYYLGVAVNTEAKIPDWKGVTTHWSDGRKDRNYNKIKDCVCNKDFWWIKGRYIGDGWIRQQGGIIICCKNSETNEITDVLDRIGWNYNISKERTVNKIHISFKEIGIFCEQFGIGASHKRLNSTIIDLPVNLLESFLKGYFSADGCFTQGKWKASSTSRELIYGIAQCVAKVYKTPFSVYHYKRNPTCTIEGRQVNQKDSYSITFKLTPCKQDEAFYENGYIWCPIRSITTEEYSGYVYNLEVKNDNSYVVQNIIVHNCTDLSLAGKRLGMSRDSNTRSSLLWEVERLLDECEELPQILLMENVPQIVNDSNIKDFNIWCDFLSSKGYRNKWAILNAKNYGIPQNRERCFMLSWRDSNKSYQFPAPIKLDIRLKDVLEKQVDEKYYLSDEKLSKISHWNSYQKPLERVLGYNSISPTLTARGAGEEHSGMVLLSDTLPHTSNLQDDFANIQVVGNYMASGHDASRIVDTNGVAPTVKENHGTVTAIVEPFIVASRGRNPDNPSDRTTGCPTEQRLEPNFSGCTNTLTTVQKDNYVCEPLQSNNLAAKIKEPTTLRIRKFTPKECWRLMSFTDEDFENAEKVVSNSQLYKQAGNSIVVNVLMHIFKELFDV